MYLEIFFVLNYSNPISDNHINLKSARRDFMICNQRFSIFKISKKKKRIKKIRVLDGFEKVSIITTFFFIFLKRKINIYFL